MILFFTASCIAGGFLLGRYIARGHARKDGDVDTTSGSRGEIRDDDDGDDMGEREDRSPGPSTAAKTKSGGVSATAKAAHDGRSARDPFTGFPCRLGDVVMRSGGDEAWLAGAVVFDEATLLRGNDGSSSNARDVDAHSVSALFVAPEAGADVLLYVRAESGAAIWWMHALASDEIVLGSDPPTSLEHGELRFERRRRLPLYAHRVGSGAPDLGSQVIVAEYSSGGYEQLLVIAGGGGPSGARAFRGIALETGMYEVIPSGASTLES